MYIRKTEKKDLLEIENIYALAKQFMRDSGNPNQWKGEYPNAFDAEEDIKNATGNVVVENDEVVGVFAFCIGEEKTYNVIYNGSWLNDKPYAFIHRIAVKYHGRGIVDFCFSECFKQFGNLRIDTHEDNIPMQKVLKRNGFIFCGEIYLENGEKRLAYQKI